VLGFAMRTLDQEVGEGCYKGVGEAEGDCGV